MGGNTWSREEICETSSLPIPMVSRLYQCNGYIKRKLWAWRVQKCIALVGGVPYLPGRCRKLHSAIEGNIGSTKEICETSSLQIPVVPCLHQCNGYIKTKLRAWRVQKCTALVGADTVLTSAGPQTTPCHKGQYRVH